MAIAGTLTVNVIASTAAFTKGMTKARKGLKSLQTRVAKVGKSVSGFGATMLGVGGTLGLGVFAKSTIDSAASLGFMADRLGISTAELEKLRFGAASVGIETKVLDMALQRMTRRVGEASLGTGAAVKTLDRLGLSAERLVKLAPDKQFAAITAELNKIPDHGDKLAGYVALFDTGGVSMLNLAAQNMTDISRAFERAGGATSTKGIENAQKFNDAVQELTTSLSATGRDLVLGITPAALEAVRGLRVIMDNIGISEEATAKAKRIKERGKFQGPLGAVTGGFDSLRRAAINVGGEVLGQLGSENLFGPIPTIERRGKGTEQVRVFQEAARQRAKQIQNSDLSLKVQQKMLQKLEEQTGVTFSAATSF